MPNITIDIPTAIAPRVLSALRACYPDLPADDLQALRQGTVRASRETLRHLLVAQRTNAVQEQLMQAAQEADVLANQIL